MITATSCLHFDRFISQMSCFNFGGYFLQKVSSAPAPADKYCVVQ